MAEPKIKNLSVAIQDVRKLRRSLKLRKETDPEAVGQILETILNEAIMLRSYNSGKIGRGAVQELRAVRRDLLAGQINSGQKTGEFIGKYSLILDQIGKIEKETTSEDDSGVGKKITSSIAQHLPSADALTAALMTANPVLGYSAKIGRDLLRARSESKSRLKSKQDERIAELNKEQAEAEAQLEEMKTSGASDSSLNEIKAKLDSIEKEIINLAKIWGDDRSANIEQVENTNETNTVLEKMQENNEDMNKNLEKISSIDEQRQRKERSDKGKSRLTEREADYETGGFSAGSLSETKTEKEPGGLDSTMFGLMSGLGGTIGSLATKIFSPFKWMFSFLLTAGASLGQFVAIGALLVSAVNGIVGFFTGFSNAAEILGKSEDELTFGDKFKAAYASMIAGILSPLNWVLNLFDMGFADNEEDIRTKVLGIIDSISNFFSNFSENISKFFSLDTLTETIIPKILAWYKAFGEFYLSIADKVSEAIFGISVTDMVENIKNKIFETISKLTDKITEILDGILDWGKSQYKSVKEGVDKGIDSIKKTTEDAKTFISEGYENTLNYFGIGSEPDNKTLMESEQKASDSLRSSSLSMNSMANDVARGGVNNTVIAPNNITNVNTTSVSMSTGPRDNDTTLARVKQRQLLFR